jgi:hypothetical protein
MLQAFPQTVEGREQAGLMDNCEAMSGQQLL